MIELSICICTMPTRYPMLARLLRELNQQIQESNAQDLIEILTDDNVVLTTGAKRNNLYQRAKGKYISTVDDDDSVYNYYIQEILAAISTDPDAVGMNGIMTTNGRFEQKWFISKDNDYSAKTRFDGSIVYSRFHNHLSPIRATIAKQFTFPEQTIGEDYAFAKAIHDAEVIKSEVRIGTDLQTWLSFASNKTTPIKPMYHYRWLSNKPKLK